MGGDERESEKTRPACDTLGYGNGPGYWNDRYVNEPEPFEWLESYGDLRELIEELTNGDRSQRILHVGCGNSIITERMYDDGYHSIVNTDTSDVVIKQMLERNRKDRPDMRWLEVDATQMDEFEDSSFDMVLDKSVLDTFACMDNACLTVARYHKEVTRVLRPGGTYLCVSYGAPSTRQRYFEMPHLEFKSEAIEIPVRSEGNQPHYAYICKEPLERGDAMKNWPEVLEQYTYQTAVLPSPLPL